MANGTAPDRTLLFAGLDHQRAPVDLRERFAAGASALDVTLARLRQSLGAVVLLSTCARVEIYVDAPAGEAGETAARAVAWFTAQAGPSLELGVTLETASGEAALRRLVRVACGLASAVEGEDEVLGQLRRAWLAAGQAGALSPLLDAACRLAVRTGRLARRRGSRDAWTSLADAAAARVAAALDGQCAPAVVIAGTGPMGLRAAEALRCYLGSAPRLSIAGRTPERVAAACARFGADPLSLSEPARVFDGADAAIVALRTRTPLFSAADLGARSVARPIVVADLSLPRAVDPAAGALPDVTLVDLDELGGAGAGHRRWDEDDRREVERLVERTVGQYAAIAGRSEAAETLAVLRMQADGIRRAQLARTFQRLPDLDAEARWTVEALSRAIVNRLLHAPTMRLKGEDAGEAATAARQIFGLE